MTAPDPAALPPGVEVDGGVVLANGFALRDLDGQVRAFLKLIDGTALVLCDGEGRALSCEALRVPVP